jgi:AraC family transcriptional regulator
LVSYGWQYIRYVVTLRYKSRLISYLPTMRTLTQGDFFGDTNQTVILPGLVLTDTEYTHPFVDWHYHEQAYITFILEGKVQEINKKNTYHCVAGDIIFHHSQEPHYNIKPKGFTRGFQIEFSSSWFDGYDLPQNIMDGSVKISAPDVKHAMYRIFTAMKQHGPDASAIIDGELVNMLCLAGKKVDTRFNDQPDWVRTLNQLLHDSADSHLLTLTELATYSGIHPVHLSRSFSAYFGCTLGEYLNLLKLQRALQLLPVRHMSLSSIAAACGFADQSHFTRRFKNLQKITPQAFRKILCNVN